MRRRIVSISCRRACTMTEFERRSATMSGARSVTGPVPGAPVVGDVGGTSVPGAVGAGGGIVGAPGTPGVTVLSRPLEKSWFRMLARSAASA